VRIADLNVGMADSPAGIWKAHHFFSAKRSFMELQGLCRTVDNQIWGCSVVTLRNRIHAVLHLLFPSSSYNKAISLLGRFFIFGGVACDCLRPLFGQPGVSDLHFFTRQFAAGFIDSTVKLRLNTDIVSAGTTLAPVY
jgi:hypothetical protein